MTTQLGPLFNVDYEDEMMVVGPNSVIEKAGDFYFRFKYYNSKKPEEAVISTETFKVVIVDGCNPPKGYPNPMTMTPPKYEPQVYTITAPSIKYEVPAWATNPDYCAGRIPYTDEPVLKG